VVVTTLVGSALTVPLYTLLRSTPHWWLWAGVLFTVVTVVGQASMPFTLRLQSGPLAAAAPPLADRVRAIGTRAGVDVGSVLVAASTKPGCNAYVVGLGPTRRIVLDGTLASWPPALIDQVVAHEIGHWRLGHAARRLPLAIAAQLLTLAFAAWALSFAPLLAWAGIADAGDPRSFPLLLLVTPLLVLPARCVLAWYDRSQEREADQFALALLDSPGHFATMLELAADEGGAARHLPWWRRLTASHPPVDERASACMRYASSG
jgi:STE24 endopeptidase